MPDFDDAALERRLRGVLEEHLGALPLDLTVEALDRRREARGGVARRFGRGRGMTLLAAAALLVVGGTLAAGSGILRLPSVVPPVPSPSAVADATASPDATSPSPSLGPPPSDPIGPLAWTDARLKEDWPAPVRAEPAGGATVLQILHRDLTPNAPSDEGHEWESDQYREPTDDTGSDVHPWADIRWVEYCREDGLTIGRVSDPPPGVDPRQVWIAYGVVVDTDGDGVPDWRYGVDNVPLDTTEQFPDPYRWWRTDLHTGRTNYAVGDHITLGDGEPGPVFWPSSGCEMSFGAETAGGGTAGNGLPERFYAWASVIVNGRVVATDYAPDVGWLDRSPDAPPLPKPGGPYVLQPTEDFPLRLSMTLPQGWTEHGAPVVTRGGKTDVRFLVVDEPEDSCSGTIEPFLGRGLDDLVSYIKALPNVEVAEVRNLSLAGYRTAYVEYRPKGLVECEPAPAGPLPLVDGYNEAWILDVDGVPLVIASSYDPTPAEAVMSEVRQIVESIQIVGVSPSLSASPTPTSSPTPSPSPRATPLPPAAGPVPPNARSWTVTVDNRSSEPATLSVAEGGEGGNLRLVGSATPNVVPAGATLKVTFLFPAKPDDGWIYVNPRPGDGGGLVNADQIGIPGKILIRDDGEGGWLSP
jgi:hypothetical protein